MAKIVYVGSARSDENGKPTEWEAVDILDKRMGLLNGYVINYLTAKVNRIMAQEWVPPILPGISDVMWIRKVAITDANGNISNYTSTVSSDQNGTTWYEFSASEGAAWTNVGDALYAYYNNPDNYTLVMTDEENTAYEGSSILDISSPSGYFMVGSNLLRYDETNDTIEYVKDVSGYSTVSSGADWYQHAVILALGHMWSSVYNW